jgi:hypothetical protein
MYTLFARTPLDSIVLEVSLCGVRLVLRRSEGVLSDAINIGAQRIPCDQPEFKFSAHGRNDGVSCCSLSFSGTH